MPDLIVNGKALLSGTVKAPPSKAHTHRAVIAASLSDGLSHVKNALLCDDTIATIEACRMLGAEIKETEGGVLSIHGIPKPHTPEDMINCGDSGSTMRFLVPICSLADGISVLTGGESLRGRPMAPLIDALGQLGVRCYSTRMDGCSPIVVFGGGIRGGKASIRGDISSQFVSGLLFASPMAQSETEIVLSTPLESKPYVEMTVGILQKHGVEVETQQGYAGFHVPCGQQYAPFNHDIEGDYSSAAFLLGAAAATNSCIGVEHLSADTAQGDREIVAILSKMNVLVEMSGDSVAIRGVEHGLKAIEVDLRDHPDLVPICAVLSCLAEGESKIMGVERLRFKESDRIDALTSELTKMGARIKATDGCLRVLGGRKLHGAEMDSHGDHRIAMACAVAALAASGKSVIRGIECINKSYPNFVRDIGQLGGNVVEQ